MLSAQVVGHAISTHCHASLKGNRLLLCQPLDADGRPAGTPIVAIDRFGAGLHAKVFVSTDGLGARHLVDDPKSPIRNFIQGIID
jgi:microcompartment protein CcmK/EutM